MADNTIAEAIVRVGVTGVASAEREIRTSAVKMEASLAAVFNRNVTPFEKYEQGIKGIIQHYSRGAVSAEIMGREVANLEAQLSKSTAVKPSADDSRMMAQERRQQQQMQRQASRIAERNLTPGERYSSESEMMGRMVAANVLSVEAMNREQERLLKTLPRAERYTQTMKLWESQVKQGSLATAELTRKKTALIGAIERQAAAERHVAAAQARGMAGGAMRGGMMPAKGKGFNQFALLELSRGLEDFTVSAQLGGFSAGMRGAANNVSTFLTMIHPMAGAIGGIGIAAGMVAAPHLARFAKELWNSKDAAGGAKKGVDQYRSSIEQLTDAMQRAQAFNAQFEAVKVAPGKMDLGQIQDRIKAIDAETDKEETNIQQLLRSRARIVSGALDGPMADSPEVKSELMNPRVWLDEFREKFFKGVNSNTALLGSGRAAKDVFNIEGQLIDANKRRADLIKERNALAAAGDPLLDKEKRGEAKKEAEADFTKAEEKFKTLLDALRVLDPLAGDLAAIEEKYRKILAGGEFTPAETKALEAAQATEIEKATEGANRKERATGISGQFSSQDFARQLQASLLKKEDKKEEKAIEKNTKDAAAVLKEQLKVQNKIADGLKNQVAKFS